MAGSFFEFSAPLSLCGVYMCGVFVWACLWIYVCGICLCGTCVWVWELMCKYRKQRSRPGVFLYHSSLDFWDRNIKHLLSNMGITNKLDEFVSKSLGSFVFTWQCWNCRCAPLCLDFIQCWDSRCAPPYLVFIPCWDSRCAPACLVYNQCWNDRCAPACLVFVQC